MPIAKSLTDNLRRTELLLTTGIKVARQQGLAALISQSIEKLQRREFHIVEPSVPYLNYLAWIEKNEPAEAELAEQRLRAQKLNKRPLFSLLTPVWNPRPEILSATLSSVLSQTYDNWELCVADGGSVEEVRHVLREFASRDGRIRVHFLNTNLGISGNTNVALQEARGEFAAFLDQDDVLAPFALYEAAACLEQQPDLDFIYSDMDRIDAEGKRSDPLFKPQWSPEIMLSANYIVHFRVLRTSLLRELGGLRTETDGAQDWDMILRASEITTKMHRIPKVLYHWRQAPTSIATAGLRLKPVHIEAQLLAISEYMSRNGMRGIVRPDRSGSLKVVLQPNPQPFVSIVIWANDPPALQRCARSVVNDTKYGDYEILAVGSNETPRMKLPHKVRLITEADGSRFASVANSAAKLAKGSVIVFLDVHAEVVSPGWLEELVGWSLQPWIGAAGLKLLSPAGKIRHGGIVVGLPDYVFSGARERSWTPLGSTEWYRNYSAVSAACLATRKDVFESIGGFDETANYASDLRYCQHLRQRSFRVLYSPFAKLVLHDCLCHTLRYADTQPANESARSSDPYFNPNLATDKSIPTIRQ